MARSSRSPRRTALVAVLALCLVGGGALAVHAVTRPRFGWGVIVRYPGSRSQPTAAANRSIPGERFAACDTPPLSPRLQRLYAQAERARRAGHGMDRATGGAWEHTQGLVVGRFEDAMRSSSPRARRDFLDLAFDNDHLTTEVFVRNHAHDAAIRDCAARMHWFGGVRIAVHRWTPGELDRAGSMVTDHFQDDRLGGLFETGRGDAPGYDITVYRGASNSDIARLRQYAGSLGVAFQIERLHEDPPRFELQ